jgi:hypothetical protein
MTASDSFTATIGFALLALASLVACNLLGALYGSTACAWGTGAAIAAIGAAYGSQLMTTNGLTCDEAVRNASTQTDLQTLREAAAFAHQWGRTLQLASLAGAILSFALMVAGLL